MKIRTAVAAVANAAVIAAMIATGVSGAKAQQTKAPIIDYDIQIVDAAELVCLQQNIYFEAGNQSTMGKVAVAWVTLNRVESSKYPTTICNVVKQGKRDAAGNMIKHKCHFSWYCDGKADVVGEGELEQRAWIDSLLVAEVVLLDWARARPSPVQDAVMYHATYVEPYWAASYSKVTQIESHIFYN